MERQQSEGARYIELVGKDGKPQAMLIGYSREWSKNITERWRQRPQEAPCGNLNAAVVDQLSKAMPAIPSFLQNGHLFQVVGTPALVEGIKNGTYTLMQPGGASLGTVVSASSHRIVGQLRFAPSSMAPVVTPFVAWSILNGITGTLQLQRINKRLDVMMRKIERLEVRQEAEVLGRVLQATKTLEDLLAEYSHTGVFIALRKHVRTLFESSINTITKAIKLIPALAHPILQPKPPMLNLVQVWRIGGQIPDLTSRFNHDFLNRLGVMKTGIVNHDDIPPLQLGY